MKKIICILFAMLLGMSIEASEGGVFCICYGTGHETAYIIRGDRICKGTGHETAFIIRGDRICKGTGHETAYIIRK